VAKADFIKANERKRGEMGGESGEIQTGKEDVADKRRKKRKWFQSRDVCGGKAIWNASGAAK